MDSYDHEHSAMLMVFEDATDQQEQMPNTGAAEPKYKRIWTNESQQTAEARQLVAEIDQEVVQKCAEKVQSVLEEHPLQEENDEEDMLPREFGRQANEFHQWMVDTRADLMEANGSLEEQLDTIRRKAQHIKAQRAKLKEVEDLGAQLEEPLILDNPYTEHTAVALLHAWDQLDQLAMGMATDMEMLINKRDHSGVSEEALREFSMMFRHFDHDKLGKLDHQQFKGCLLALGYDLPMVDEGQPDPDFEGILDRVDPNRDGYVTFDEFLGVVIKKKTENVRSSSSSSSSEEEEEDTNTAKEGMPIERITGFLSRLGKSFAPDIIKGSTMTKDVVNHTLERNPEIFKRSGTKRKYIYSLVRADPVLEESVDEQQAEAAALPCQGPQHGGHGHNGVLRQHGLLRVPGSETELAGPRGEAELVQGAGPSAGGGGKRGKSAPNVRRPANAICKDRVTRRPPSNEVSPYRTDGEEEADEGDEQQGKKRKKSVTPEDGAGTSCSSWNL